MPSHDLLEGSGKDVHKRGISRVSYTGYRLSFSEAFAGLFPRSFHHWTDFEPFVFKDVVDPVPFRVMIVESPELTPFLPPPGNVCGSEGLALSPGSSRFSAVFCAAVN